MKRKIWIDVGYPPHALVLTPIIRELEKRGHEVSVTARQAFETCALLDLKKIEYRKIGKHPGKKKLFKIAGTLIRALQLILFARNKNFSVALAHGSPSQGLAAKFLGIPYIIMTDYEHTVSRMILSTKMMVPDYIPDSVLQSRKIDLKKLAKYPGLKEDIYVKDFSPDPSILEELNLDKNKIIATLRPPATDAGYHNPESESLLYATLDCLTSDPRVQVVLLARQEQVEIRSRCRGKYNGRVTIPEKAVDGLNLVWHSDMVVSGGGTMNREAAALGVPAYSIFRSKIAAVDKYLVQEGKLQFITSVQAIGKIRIEKREPVWPVPTNENLVPFIVSEILSVAK